MKKVLVAALIIVLGLALIGCAGSSTETAAALDKTVTIADGEISFKVSSDWKQTEGLVDSGVHEYLFQAGTGMFSITHYSYSAAGPDEGLESIKQLYAETYNVTDFKEISRNESSRDGMTIVVFEYSYNDPDDGETIERLAYISKGKQQVVIFYLNYADRFNPANFDALLNSLQWK
ncbi:MAG: hypothetical protein FWE41_05585 [Coriobacteriia bacterium]|nr:hypothetical protein [Coriobacteriia bacterium]MCL2749431.1 hypothetical protein [Coriobacteriia bacterium]